jgi:hypothetical protein
MVCMCSETKVDNGRERGGQKWARSEKGDVGSVQRVVRRPAFRKTFQPPTNMASPVRSVRRKKG